MSKLIRLNIYLSKQTRERYLSIHKNLSKKFITTMETVFNDIEGGAEKYKNQLLKEYGSAYNYETVDPSDVFEHIEMEAHAFYKAEKLMEYNFHLSLLASTYQIFEQQLRAFIYSEINQKFSPVRIEVEFSKFGINMGQIKEEYERLNYNLTNTSQWKTIELLADLVNTYKHGDGRSAKRLYDKNPELFLKSHFEDKKLMDVELTTNTEIVFNIEKIGFDRFINAILDFWGEFPEYLNPVVEVN